jgi:hypothetical protein
LSKYINVERIEFVITFRCNSHCKHCSVDRGKRGLKPAAINSELATQIVKKVAREYSPTSVMTFGGEPLLFPEVVCAIHEAAKTSGISRREIITNAGWPRSETGFRAVALKLAESGVTDVAVSVDGFHQEHIPIDVVEHNVRALVDAGISVGWNPCWVISKDHRNPWNERTKSVLRDLGHLPVTESYGNTVYPAGNALKWLLDFMPSKTAMPIGSCEDVPYAGRLDQVTSISVEPDLSISVCKQFAIGNAGESDVLDILQSYNPYEIHEMKAILHGGTTDLREFAYRKGIALDPSGYYSICDMCIDLRRKLAKLSPT